MIKPSLPTLPTLPTLPALPTFQICLKHGTMVSGGVLGGKIEPIDIRSYEINFPIVDPEEIFCYTLLFS